MRTCIPHDGELDDQWRPLQDGVLYLPGERRCKMKDCVNPKHITLNKDNALEAERWSTWYRTKKQLNYEQLLATLERERLCSTRTNAAPVPIEWLLREPLRPKNTSQSV